jgi:hypothetical protein
MLVERIIPLEDREGWERALEAVPHMFGHTWGSAHAHRLTTGHRTFLYEARDGASRVVCPLVERPVGDRCDLAGPYGVAGLAGTGPWSGVAGRLAVLAQGRGYVTGFITINPLFGDSSYAGEEKRTAVNDAYALDLALGPEALYREMSSGRRRELRTWRAALHEDHHAPLAAFFCDLHPRFMERKGAPGHHRLARATLEALCAQPGVFLLGAPAGGPLEAVSVYGYTRHAADRLFSAWLPGGERHSAALDWSAAHRLCELGIPWLNLGGGLRRGDSLAEYKRRFGPEARPVWAIREVYDRPAYVDLCRCAGRDPEDRDAFFPPYRSARAI